MQITLRIRGANSNPIIGILDLANPETGSALQTFLSTALEADPAVTIMVDRRKEVDYEEFRVAREKTCGTENPNEAPAPALDG